MKKTLEIGASVFAIGAWLILFLWVCQVFPPSCYPQPTPESTSPTQEQPRPSISAPEA